MGSRIDPKRDDKGVKSKHNKEVIRNWNERPCVAVVSRHVGWSELCIGRLVVTYEEIDQLMF
jgi:hypothetical protein